MKMVLTNSRYAWCIHSQQRNPAKVWLQSKSPVIYTIKPKLANQQSKSQPRAVRNRRTEIATSAVDTGRKYIYWTVTTAWWMWVPGVEKVCLLLKVLQSNVKRVIGTTCFRGRQFPLSLLVVVLLLFGDTHPLAGRNHHHLRSSCVNPLAAGLLNDGEVIRLVLVSRGYRESSPSHVNVILKYRELI